MQNAVSRLLWTALVASFAVTATANPRQDPTVYGTKTGKKYHRGTCSSLKKSKIAMKLSEAKSKGLTPCKKCKPGE